MSDSFPFPSSTAFPGHPASHRVFEHATKLGHVVGFLRSKSLLIRDLVDRVRCFRDHHTYLYVDDYPHSKGILTVIEAKSSIFVCSIISLS